MASFTLTIADSDTGRVTNALSQAGGFVESSEENAMATVMAFIQQTVANVEGAQARQVALDAIEPSEPVDLS